MTEHSLLLLIPAYNEERRIEPVLRDYARYFQAFPALKEGAQPALAPEAQIPSGQSLKGSVIVAFPIKLDAFNQRKSISVLIWPYNETVPVTITK